MSSTFLFPVSSSSCGLDLDDISSSGVSSDPYVSGQQPSSIDSWVSTSGPVVVSCSSVTMPQTQTIMVGANQVVLINDCLNYPQQNYLPDGVISTNRNASTRPPGKVKRRRWNYNDMVDAYRAVKERGMSLRAAATAFCVPESTLRDRVHGRVSLECTRPGPATFFTYAEERRMVEHIILMARIGYPFTRNQMVEMAGDMTRSVARAAPFKYLNPSQAWFYSFVNRWPELRSFVAPKNTQTPNSRIRPAFPPPPGKPGGPVTQKVLDAYYSHLDRLLTRYDIKNCPEHVWTVDEVCVTCDQQPPKLLPQ